MKRLQLVAGLAAVWLFMFLSGRAWSAARSAVAIEAASTSSLLQRPLRSAQRGAEDVFHTLQRVASKLDQTSSHLQRQAQGAASAAESLPEKVADNAIRQDAPLVKAVAAAHAEPHSAHVRPDKAPHIPGFAPLKAAAPPRPPPGRSWLEEGNPFYKQRDSGHKCVKLGRVLFEEPHKTGGSEAPAGNGRGIGKRTLEVEFPPWRMAWPHMASQQHSEWFKNFEIAGWRRRRCVPPVIHSQPQQHNLAVAGYLRSPLAFARSANARRSICAGQPAQRMLEAQL